MSQRAAGWFTSSYSNEANACVEVRFTPTAVLLADSKNHGAGPEIAASAPDWDAFVATALGTPSTPTPALTITPAAADGRTVTAVP